MRAWSARTWLGRDVTGRARAARGLLRGVEGAGAVGVGGAEARSEHRAVEGDPGPRRPVAQLVERDSARPVRILLRKGDGIAQAREVGAGRDDVVVVCVDGVEEPVKLLAR